MVLYLFIKIVKIIQKTCIFRALYKFQSQIQPNYIQYNVKNNKKTSVSFSQENKSKQQQKVQLPKIQQKLDLQQIKLQVPRLKHQVQHSKQFNKKNLRKSKRQHFLNNSTNINRLNRSSQKINQRLYKKSKSHKRNRSRNRKTKHKRNKSIHFKRSKRQKEKQTPTKSLTKTLLSKASDCDKKVFSFLTRDQLVLCKRNLQLMASVVEAASSSIHVCRELFEDRRWNCSSLELVPKLRPDLTAG